MTKKLYNLTQEHKARFPEWRDKWIANALKCGEYTEKEIKQARVAIRGLYRAADLKPPKIEVVCKSPISASIAAGVAAGVWWLRKNPGKHVELFGRPVSELEIMSAIAPACAHTVKYGVAELRGEAVAVLPAIPTGAATGAATDAATYAATGDATRAATDAATYAATGDATRAATDAATGAATDAATYAATRDATYAATGDATRAATDAATYAATDAATRDATGAATRDATGAATGAATRAATRDATYAATYAATDAATRAATYAATDAATGAATRAATDAATDAATYAATDAATRDATGAATGAATRAATGAATDAATYAATRAATGAATDAATYAATGDATRAATDAATYAATGDATYAATGDATRAATYAATRAATRDATRAATDAATYAATRAATRDATGAVVRFLIHCANRGLNFRQGGNQWSGWTAYLSFFRHVAKLDLPVYEKFDSYEQATKFGPRFIHEDFWILSEFPDFIKQDAENRPHCETGPFCKWRDGWSLYYWHGVRIPAAWIENKQNINPSLALTWQNIEQRRCLAEILGWKTVLAQLNPEVINTDDDPEIGQLLEVSLPDAGRARFLKVKCGTGREFVLSVPVEMKTALQANAWTFNLEPLNFKPEVRT